MTSRQYFFSKKKFKKITQLAKKNNLEKTVLRIQKSKAK